MMKVSTMGILTNDGGSNPLLMLDRQSRDALATYVNLRWPVGTRKAVAKEFGLSIDAARTVCEGTPSQTTIDKIWKSPRGGWRVALPILGAVIGQSIEDFYQQEAKEHAAQAPRLAQTPPALSPQGGAEPCNAPKCWAARRRAPWKPRTPTARI